MVADAQVEKMQQHQNIRPLDLNSKHNSIFGLKDLYFVNPLGTGISMRTSEWENISKAEWIKPQVKSDVVDSQYKIIQINKNCEIKIPFVNKELEKVFLESKYILDLKDDWDDEGSIGYSVDSWKSGADFLINFNKWLKDIFSGNLYLPKIHHGPKGTIDIVWQEKDFRLFINIDYLNNKGNFYSDTPNKQFTEGEFLLDNIKFQLLPLPFKY